MRVIDLTQDDLLEIAKEMKCSLKAWHELPSVEMSDTLMSHLYDKFSERFGINVFEDCP